MVIVLIIFLMLRRWTESHSKETKPHPENDCRCKAAEQQVRYLWNMTTRKTTEMKIKMTYYLLMMLTAGMEKLITGLQRVQTYLPQPKEDSFVDAEDGNQKAKWINGKRTSLEHEKPSATMVI